MKQIYCFYFFFIIFLFCSCAETSEYSEFTIKFSEVSGLSYSSEVTQNGLNIGSISKMAISPDGQSVFVTVILNENVKVSTFSEAEIINKDLLGTKAIAIETNLNETFLTKNDTIQGSYKKRELDTLFIHKIDRFIDRGIDAIERFVEDSLRYDKRDTSNDVFSFNKKEPDFIQL